MYRLINITGDTVAVPQLVFSKLSAPGSDDGRFRVALYLLHHGSGNVAGLSAALKLPKGKVEAALNYWEGAGLLEQEAALAEPPPPVKRRTMTTREVVSAGEADPALAQLLDELQRLIGTVIEPEELNRFVTLYVQDKYPTDLILLATSYSMVRRGSNRANYIRQVLNSWNKDGVCDCTSADVYLKLEEERTVRDQKLAERLGYHGGDPFSYADKKKIIQWFEEFCYDFDMIDTARLVAGDNANDVRYLHSTLKKWYAKGYRTVRDVQQSGGNSNLRTMREQPSSPQKDLLLEASNYVPLKKRGAK